jgi:hypothetical protein
MANEGFRGTVVRVAELVITPGAANTPILQCTIHFMAETGDVHAIGKHSFVLSEEAEDNVLALAAKELFRALVSKVERIHYATPSGDDNRLARGISEALRAQADAEDDEPGIPG